MKKYRLILGFTNIIIASISLFLVTHYHIYNFTFLMWIFAFILIGYNVSMFTYKNNYSFIYFSEIIIGLLYILNPIITCLVGSLYLFIMSAILFFYKQHS